MNKYTFLLEIELLSYNNHNNNDFNKKINRGILLNLVISDEVSKLLLIYNVSIEYIYTFNKKLIKQSG